ncbi:MAG: hypothetical protein U0326_12340 [Polyangiales bacterium]
MLLALWGYALLNGVVHAREIVRLTRSDVDRWIVGDVLVERSTSRSSSSAIVTRCWSFSDLCGALMQAGLLMLPSQRMAQDGTRVNADASRRSFQTAAQLEACREQAARHLKATLAKMDDPPLSARAHRGRVHAAQHALRRIEAATRAAREVTERRARGARTKRNKATRRKRRRPIPTRG